MVSVSSWASSPALQVQHLSGCLDRLQAVADELVSEHERGELATKALVTLLTRLAAVSAALH